MTTAAILKPDHFFKKIVRKNKFGYYDLKKKPSVHELEHYYRSKYFQENKGPYAQSYTKEEIRHIYNKFEEKYHLLLETKKIIKNRKYRVLDVGCGEGFTLKYFKKMNWDVMGIDYTDSACHHHNPDCADLVRTGDIYKTLITLKSHNKFDLIWVDNVLEHVLKPIELLKFCKRLSKKNTLLVIEVPNDFSAIQMKALNSGLIDKPFWIAIPDHINYFNKEGLINLCKYTGWNSFKIVGDFPIDFNLYNESSNYILNREHGKNAHRQRVKIENLFHSISIQKVNRFYESLADLGLGRQLIGIFTTA